MVEQFTIDGNILNLRLNASPMGENANTTCMFYLDLSTNFAYISASFNSLNYLISLNPSCTADISSGKANKLGISPLLRMLLISSTKPSCAICVSLNRKTVGLASIPAYFKISRILSCQSFIP